MRWRPWLVSLLAVAVLLPGCLSESSLSPTRMTDSFEDGLDAWSKHAELTGGAARGGWGITTTTSPVTDGNTSVNVTLDAREQDGAVWITRTLEVDPGVDHQLRVLLDVFSPQARQQPQARLMLRIGPQAPGSLADFPETRDEDPVVWGIKGALDVQHGWRRYEASGSLPSLDTGTAYVSVGIEIQRHAQLDYVLDDLDVLLVPEPLGEGTGTSPV